jgi:hypothetical protein
MSERATRLSEQLTWLVDADLTPEAKTEALMAEMAVFMDDGPPKPGAEMTTVMEARVIVTLMHAEPTPLLRRYVSERLLDSWAAR